MQRSTTVRGGRSGSPTGYRTRNGVEHTMHAGRENYSVNLPKPVLILIVYASAVADENGEVHFFRDIYGHDAALAATLAFCKALACLAYDPHHRLMNPHGLESNLSKPTDGGGMRVLMSPRS